jgi:hypothetical protein
MICGENLLNDHGLALYDSLIKVWVQSGITEEKNARILADELLSADLSSISAELSGETEARIAAISALTEALQQEILDRENAISDLSSVTESLSAATVSEIERIDDLIDAIDSPIYDIQVNISGLTNDLANEVKERELADLGILEALSAETINRSESDDNIIDLIVDETDRAERVESEISNSLNELSANTQSAIEEEIAARESGDTAILDELRSFQEITKEQIDFLFGGSAKVVVNVDEEFAEFVDITVIPKFANNGDGIRLGATIKEEASGVFGFDGWYVDGVKVSDSTVFDTVFNKTSSYEAKLYPLTTIHTIRFVSNDSNMGTAYASVDGEQVTEIIVIEGESATFTPHTTPNDTYEFVSWNGGLVDGQEFTLQNVTEDIVYMATFRKITHTLTFSTNPSMGSVYVNTPGTVQLIVNEGDSVAFTPVAVPNSGYEFTSWSGGIVDGQENTITNIRSDMSFVASFTQVVTYTITVISNNPSYGNVWLNNYGTTQIVVMEGNDITFTPYASAESGYEFTSWSGGLINGNPYTLYNVQQNYTFMATFEEIVYHTISFYSNDYGMGGVYVNEPGITQLSVRHGRDITFTPYANAESGYELNYWSGDLENGQSYTLTNVTSDVNYYAYFKSQSQQVDTTYVFNDKSWSDSHGVWTSENDGFAFVQDRGVQITSGASGAGAKSNDDAFNNVSKVVFTYSTNASKGVGDITVNIGGYSETKSVTKNGGIKDREIEFVIDSPQSGTMYFGINCTQNSIYVKDITVTHEE